MITPKVTPKGIVVEHFDGPRETVVGYSEPDLGAGATLAEFDTEVEDK